MTKNFTSLTIDGLCPYFGMCTKIFASGVNLQKTRILYNIILVVKFSKFRVRYVLSLYWWCVKCVIIHTINSTILLFHCKFENLIFCVFLNVTALTFV